MTATDRSSPTRDVHAAARAADRSVRLGLRRAVDAEAGPLESPSQDAPTQTTLLPAVDPATDRARWQAVATDAHRMIVAGWAGSARDAVAALAAAYPPSELGAAVRAALTGGLAPADLAGLTPDGIRAAVTLAVPSSAPRPGR